MGYTTEIGNLDWATPRDRRTEAHVLARTGLSVRRHQHLTVVDYLRLPELDPDLPFTPVLQEQTITDYHRCADMYEQRGVDLAALPLVGVGNVCRRSRDFVRVSRSDGVSGGWECPSAPPNNAHYLRAAQQRRRAELIDKVRDALRELDATGQPITVNAVMRASGASLAFIYRLPDIVAQIQKLRDQQVITSQRQPTRQRASDGSNHARIRHLTAASTELRTEVQRLRDQNALLLGQLREQTTAANPPSTPQVHPQ